MISYTYQYRQKKNTISKQNASGRKIKEFTFRCVPIYAVLDNCITWEASIPGVGTMKHQNIAVVQDWIEDKMHMKDVCC